MRRAGRASPLRQCANFAHKIHLKPGTVLRAIKTRQMAPDEEAELGRIVDELIADGVVVPAPPGTIQRNPVVLVQKKDKSRRMTLNLMYINRHTIPVQHTSARTDDAQRRLRGAVTFSKIDLKSAYFSVPLDAESQPLTAFEVPGKGVFMMARMPMGLVDSGATMQHIIDVVLAPFRANVFAYLDDVLIFSRKGEDHAALVAAICEALEAAGLTINVDKSVIGEEETEYLNSIYSQAGVRPNPRYLDALDKLATPTDRQSLQRVVGMFGYYRRFIANAAELFEPLHKALPEAQSPTAPLTVPASALEKAMTALRSALRAGAVLAYPDYDKDFALASDASEVGIGGTLEQDGRIVALFSRALSKSERNYSTVKREALALVEALDFFRPIVGSHSVRASVDHQPLVYLYTQAERQSLAARWLARLALHNVSLGYIKGQDNVTADLMSRLYLKAESHDAPSLVLAAQASTLSVTQRYEKLRAVHVGLGHCGIGRLLQALREGRVVGFTPYRGWSMDVVHTVAVCGECQRLSGAPAPYPALGSIGSTKLFEEIAVDVIEIAPNAKLLTIVEAFSRFAWAFIVPDETANTLATFAYKALRSHRLPARVRSDRHPSFTSAVFEAMLKSHNMKPTTTLGYAPYQNGQVERLQQTLLDMIRALCIDGRSAITQTDIDAVVAVYNQLPHSATGVAPVELIFGATMRSTLLGGGGSIKSVRTQQEAMSLASKRIEKLHTKKAQERAEAVMRLGIKVRPGDMVLVYDTARANSATRKLRTDKYQGPYYVTDASLSTVTVLQDGKRIQLPINRCKRFHMFETHQYWRAQLNVERSGDRYARKPIRASNGIKVEVNQDGSNSDAASRPERTISDEERIYELPNGDADSGASTPLLSPYESEDEAEESVELGEAGRRMARNREVIVCDE